MVLHDLKFPDDLAERCKEFTGQATGTGAVRETCARALEMQHEVRELRLKLKDSQADLDDARRLLADDVCIHERKKKLLAELAQDNRFRLHGG